MKGNGSMSRIEVGEVLHMSKSGRIIIKSKIESIDIGTTLVDEKGRKVARVVELIGPVNSPYISAIPLTDRSKRYVGAMLYKR